MNCKKCGSPLMENDQFCKNCGATVNEINAPMGMGQPSQMAQPTMGFDQNKMMGTTMGTMTQPVNNYNPEPPKKNNNIVIIVTVIIAVAIFAAIVVLGIFFMTKDDKKVDEPDTEENTNNNNETPTEPTQTSSTYTVKSNGFTLNIPDHLIYEDYYGDVMIGDETGTWVAVITIMEGNYSQVARNKNQVKINIESSGYEVENMVEDTVSDIDYLGFELTDETGASMLMGYAPADSTHTFGFVIMDIDNLFNYDALEEIAPIFENAEYTGDSNSIAPSTDIDLEAFAKVTE